MKRFTISTGTGILIHAKWYLTVCMFTHHDTAALPGLKPSTVPQSTRQVLQRQPERDCWTISPLKLFVYLFIEFIRVTLVNESIQVSGAQFYNTSSVYCIVCSHPKVVSFHHHLSPSTLLYLPHRSFLLAITVLLAVSIALQLWTHSSVLPGQLLLSSLLTEAEGSWMLLSVVLILPPTVSWVLLFGLSRIMKHL